MQNAKPLSSEGARLRFFTSAEVAEILKMHPQVITRKLQAGDIQGYKLGKDWRVSEAQLMEFLERHSNSVRAGGNDRPLRPGGGGTLRSAGDDSTLRAPDSPPDLSELSKTTRS